VASFLAWLTSLPLGLLYAILAIVAAIENVFPPFPADTVVAFGAFLAARGQGTALDAFLATWCGNTIGAMGMYAAGRRFGAARLRRWLDKKSGDTTERRLATMYGRYGMLALFTSRFLPAVRALVPPFAGALKLPPVRAGIIIATASGLWYGLVTYVAYGLGANWETVLARIEEWQRTIGLIAVVALALGVAAWLVMRRRRDAG
jgi:membrane protein DedA with SNARE-associated domain